MHLSLHDQMHSRCSKEVKQYFLNFVVGITTKTPLDFHIQLFKPITNETFVEYNLPPQFNEIQRGSTDDPPSFAESAPG